MVCFVRNIFMPYLNRIIGVTKEIFLKIPYRELTLGILSGLLSTALIIGYTKYKQVENVFLLLRKEINTTTNTIKTITTDKKLGAPLLLNLQVPNKYWETMTNDEFNLLYHCDQNRNIENFYLHVNILRTYYELVTQMLTNGKYPMPLLQKSIDQEQTQVLLLGEPAKQSADFCRDKLLLNRLKRQWYAWQEKI